MVEFDNSMDRRMAMGGNLVPIIGPPNLPDLYCKFTSQLPLL